MSSVILSLLFDCILGALLIATISYCTKLSRRIRFLQDSRGELASMITQFDHATDRATTSLVELQAVSKKITDALQLKIDKANFLADDLAFLIEKSTKLANQLEQTKTALAEAPLAKNVSAFEPQSQFTSKQKPSFNLSPLTNDQNSPQFRATKSLEAVLHRLSEHPSPSKNTVAKTTILHMTDTLPRTDAERDLLEALKSGRQ